MNPHRLINELLQGLFHGLSPPVMMLCRIPFFIASERRSVSRNDPLLHCSNFSIIPVREKGVYIVFTIFLPGKLCIHTAPMVHRNSVSIDTRMNGCCVSSCLLLPVLPSLTRIVEIQKSNISILAISK